MGDKPPPRSPAVLKAVFHEEAKSRMKNLVEKTKSLRRRRDAKAAIALEDLFDPNDTKDFQDSPKALPSKSKLRLKRNTSTSGTSRQNQAKTSEKQNKKDVEASGSSAKRGGSSSVASSSLSLPTKAPTTTVPQSSHGHDDVIVVEAPKEVVVDVVEILDETSEADVAARPAGVAVFPLAQGTSHESDKENAGNTAATAAKTKADISGNPAGGSCEPSSSVATTTKTCQVCQTEVLAAVLDQHISSCLRSNFSKGKGQGQW